MPITSKAALIVELDKVIDQTDLNTETRGILSELLAICQRSDRSMERERKFKSKKLGGGVQEAAIKQMPANFDPNSYIPEEKKREIAQPVSEPIKSEDEPIEIEQKDETLPMKVFNLYNDGLEKAIQNYPKPGQFKKALKEIGLTSEGKTHEEIWLTLEGAYNEINK